MYGAAEPDKRNRAKRNTAAGWFDVQFYKLFLLTSCYAYQFGNASLMADT